MRYLPPNVKRGEAGLCYSPDARVCLNCPLAPAVCETSVGDDSRLKSRTTAPDCLRDYAIWKLAPYLKPLPAREIGGRLAGLLDPKRAATADLFRRAVDIEAARRPVVSGTNGAAGEASPTARQTGHVRRIQRGRSAANIA